MRFWYFTFCWIALTFYSNGQSNKPKNELGVSLFQVSFNSFENQFSSGGPLLEKGISLNYKRKIYDFFYLRANHSYYFTNNESDMYRSYYNYNFKKHYSSLGAEVRYYQTKNKKTQLYSGIDLTGFLIKAQVSNMFFSNDFGKAKGLGIQPFMGIEINPIRNCFISYEVSVLAAMFQMETQFDDRVFFAPQTSSNVSSSPSPYFHFAPLRFLSLGVKF